jgi:hypothetical protein
MCVCRKGALQEVHAAPSSPQAGSVLLAGRVPWSVYPRCCPLCRHALRIHCGVCVVSAGVRRLSREHFAFCRYPVLNSLLSVCHGLRRLVVPAFGVWFALDLPDGAQSLSSVSSQASIRVQMLQI